MGRLFRRRNTNMLYRFVPNKNTENVYNDIQFTTTALDILFLTCTCYSVTVSTL